MVLATVHAKSTFQTISRLEGLGISNDELKNCLTAISYQRLMPSDNEVRCLMDIASGESLKSELNKSIRSDFVSWQKNLNALWKGGEINDEVYWQYQEG